MDSGLGSDEDRRTRCSRTKEQKQLLNQQLMSSNAVNGACFIDASSLQDDDDVLQQQQQQLRERRQGALLFQTSIPQYSTLQMPDTPFNSIVHIQDAEEEEEVPRALGFYVDLADIDVPSNEATSEASTDEKKKKKKNMFSMVIDFEAARKEKPARLGAAPRVRRKSSECGSDGSSSLGWLGGGAGAGSDGGCFSTGSGEVLAEAEDAAKRHEEEVEVPKDEAKEVKFVRLSDLEASPVAAATTAPSSDAKHTQSGAPAHQQPTATTTTTTRMSRSIPESSWLESPLSLMSRSTGYRVAPSTSSGRERERGRGRDRGDEGQQSGGGSGGSGQGCSSSLSDSAGSKSGVAQKRLGTDLLRMFLDEIDTDVVLHIGNRTVKAHRCILISRWDAPEVHRVILGPRCALGFALNMACTPGSLDFARNIMECQYFAGTLRQRALTLDGFSYDAVHFALCHIYSGAGHVPHAISLVELASLADLLALEGLKEVVAHELRARHCHHFHAPCSGCVTGVLEVLPLAASYALDALYHRCLRWLHRHYQHIWPTRPFARLPADFQRRCLQQHIVHLAADTVLGTLVGAGRILDALPVEGGGGGQESSWAGCVRELVQRLREECGLWLRGQYDGVLGHVGLVVVDGGREEGCVEEVLLGTVDLLTLDQTCRSYGRCVALLAPHTAPLSTLPPHVALLRRIRARLEGVLVARADRLLRSVTWTKLEPALRARIKELLPVADEQGSRHYRNSSHNAATTGIHSSSSESSSRNSSPATSQIQQQQQHGSPSLRRSLLLAARAPQHLHLVAVVPPSPAAVRRSTLTQPTASSAAKSAAMGAMAAVPLVGGGGGVVKQQHHYVKSAHAATHMSKSYHHQYNRPSTTTTTNAITHTRSAGSIPTTTTTTTTITHKPTTNHKQPQPAQTRDSPKPAKRQIPVRKVSDGASAVSPLVLRKTASSGAVMVGSGGGRTEGVTAAVPLAQSQKRQSPIMARYLLPRKRDIISPDPTTNTAATTKPPRTPPACSPRMRTKSAETAKTQAHTTKQSSQRQQTGSVSTTHSPIKQPHHYHYQNHYQPAVVRSASPRMLRKVVVAADGASPVKVRQQGVKHGGDKGVVQSALVNGVGKGQQQQEDKAKRRTPQPRTVDVHDRSDSPVSFDMTETVVTTTRRTRPVDFSTVLGGTDPPPVTLKSLVDAQTPTQPVHLMQRSGTFLKDEPSVLPPLE